MTKPRFAGAFYLAQEIEMKWLIEQFFGKWECLVVEVRESSGWVIVCHKHTVTGRVKGYVDMGRYPFYELEEQVVLEHIEKYGTSELSQ